jgi:hypothetical protein
MRRWGLIALVCFMLTAPPIVMGGCLGAIALLGGSAEACSPNSPVAVAPADVKVKSAGDLNGEQIRNAQIIIGIAKNRRLGARDALVALMVAMQESKLTNLNRGDRDSRGIFQQRASWGTLQERLNPVIATNKFYDALVTVTNRGQMSLLDVALAVQRPSRAAYLDPSNYFPGWESLARELLGGNYQPSDSAPELVQVGCSSSSTDTGVAGKVEITPGANRPGVSITPITMAYLAKVAGIYEAMGGKALVVTTGTNHPELTVDGNVSDHWDGHAADIGMAANGGTDDGPVGDAIMTACLVAAGDSPEQAAATAKVREGPVQTRVHDGLRIQCIWGTYAGGNHHNHVHVGARPA